MADAKPDAVENVKLLTARRPKNGGCPHCGDTRHGYRTIIVMRSDRFYGWDETDQDTDNTKVLRESHGRCKVCDGPIKLPPRGKRV